MSNLITPYCKYTTNFELFSLLQISTNLTEICFADMICQPFLNDKTPFDSDKEKSWYPILVFTLYTITTVEIVISEQWSWKVAWFLKEHHCPARNHTTLHDVVLLVTFSTVLRCTFRAFSSFFFIFQGSAKVKASQQQMFLKKISKDENYSDDGRLKIWVNFFKGLIITIF